MEKQVKLLPCPFCNGEAEIVYCEEGCCGSKIRAVECTNNNCSAEMFAEEASITAWNTRHCSVDEIIAELDRRIKEALLRKETTYDIPNDNLWYECVAIIEELKAIKQFLEKKEGVWK